MTGDHLSTILKQANAKADKDGWDSLPEGATRWRLDIADYVVRPTHIARKPQ